MRKYLEILKMSYKNAKAYKFEYIIFIFATLVGMSVSYFIWNSVYYYNHAETLGGLTLQQMISYAVVSMAVISLIWSSTDRMIYSDVNQGYITEALIKPVRIQPYVFFRDSGRNIMTFFIETVLAMVVAYFIFNISIPPLLSLAAFFISIFLSLLISFSLAFLVWLSAFWTEKSDGLRRLKEAIIDLFSGFLIPLYLFPLWIQPVLFLLPFQAIINTPLSIFIEKISGTQIAFALLVQIFWSTVLLLAGNIVWKKARKKYTAHGV